MSWDVSLYIDHATSIEALADEIRNLLGVALEQVIEEGQTEYRHSDEDFELSLYSNHGMENDRDLNFEDYAYALSLWRASRKDPEQAQANILNFSRLAFQKFKGTGRYALMLVQNSQKKLDSFQPT